jgi:cytochrome P450
MSTLAELVRLEDSDFYLENTYPVLARLRAEAPTFYYEPLDMWVLSKYEDIRHVGRTPEVFSSHEGILLNDFRYGNVLKSFFPPNAENFALENPPRHNDLRRFVHPAFSPRIVTRLEDTVRGICRELLDEIDPDTPVNWSKLIAEPLPLMVIALLLGLPLSDLDRLQYWSDEIIKMGLAAGHEEIAAAAAGLAPMGEYFEERLAERREHMTDDLIGTLEQARAGGLINNETVHMMLSGVMAAGNETTRNVINGAVIALCEHPAEMRKLVDDPAKIKNATEEFLRWVCPVRGFGRTVVQDTDVRGQAMKVGQHVFNFYMSGNRDEEIFSDPEVFDVSRDQTFPHLAFGFGQHNCIGSALARMEIRVLFEEAISRFGSVELAGAVPKRQLLVNAWSDVTVSFGAG